VRKLEQRRLKNRLCPRGFFEGLTKDTQPAKMAVKQALRQSSNKLSQQSQGEDLLAWYASEGFLDFLELTFSALLGSFIT